MVRDTIKGSVAHVKPPAEAVARASERTTPRWIVVPRYMAGIAPRLDRLSKARALMQLIDNAFNFNVHARRAFDLLSATIDKADCYTFSYSSLDDAVARLDSLARTACPH